MTPSAEKLVTIERVRATEVVVPIRSDSQDSIELGEAMDGIPWPQMPICIIEATCSDGITGLGEVVRGVSLNSIESALKQLPGLEMHGLSPACVPDSWKPGTLWGLQQRYPVPVYSLNSPIAGALEMVRMDWAGKKLNCRAVDLLGGVHRESIPVDYWCSRRLPKDLEKTIAKAKSMGFKGLKMKSRLGDPVAEQVRAIKSVGGDDFSITIDPMFQWISPHDGLDNFRALEPIAHKVRIEDPFPQDQPDMWRRAMDRFSIPLIWHARDPVSLRRALQERCTDDFNCSGGLAEFLVAAHAVEALGYACWHGSSIEMGIGQVAHVHTAAAARACTMPSDFVSGIVREHTLITWDWPYKDGHLPLPKGPGIGVELDRDAMKKYQTAAVEF
jgi:muconate cycloisomerase